VSEENEMNAETDVLATEDSSPSTDVQPESNDTSGNEPEWFQKRINDITAQKYEFKTQAEQASKQLEEVQQRLKELEAGQQQAIPQAPDEDLKYDDPEKYRQAYEDYQKALVQNAVDSQMQAAKEAERQRQLQEQEQQEQLAVIERAKKNAEQHGISFAEVDQSALRLQQMGVRPELSEIIMSHENVAPLIHHLAQNPADFDSVNNAVSVVDMVRQLDGIQSKALTRNISSAPEPVKGLQGLPAGEPDAFRSRFPNAQIKRG